MKYACLIYHDETIPPQWSEEEVKANMDAHYAFIDKMQKRGAMLGGEALRATNSATSVRVNADGKVLTTDGPFAETKEQLGGFYLLECENLDEAIECAAQIPEAKGGTIEIRPLMVFD